MTNLMKSNKGESVCLSDDKSQTKSYRYKENV